MTFERLCILHKVTPEERIALLRMLAFVRWSHAVEVMIAMAAERRKGA